MWASIIAAAISAVAGLVGNRMVKSKAKAGKSSSAGDIASAVANMATSIGGAISANNQIKQQQRFNASEAQKARDWNLEMDNTKYQRTVADMQNAGVNPALAIDGHLSTQAASNAQAQAESGVNAMTSLATLVMNTQLKNKELAIQNKLADAEINLKNAQTLNVEKTTSWIDELNDATIGKIKAETDKIFSDITVNDSVIKVNGVKIDLYDAQTGLFKAQMTTEEKEQQLIAAKTAVENLNRDRLQLIMPYVQLREEAELAYTSAKTDEAKAAAYEKLTQADKNLADAAVSNSIVESGYYEKLGLKFDAEKGLIEQKTETEKWNTKQAKRDFKWTGVNNAVSNICRVVTTGCQLAGTIATGGAGGVLVKPSPIQPVSMKGSILDPASIYTGSGQYSWFK